MDGFLAFGDVFRYREGEYVYLCGNEDLTYAAKILDRESSRRLKAMCERAVMSPRMSARVDELLTYCFVTLRTPGYVDQAAHYAQPGNSEFGDSGPVEKICELVEEDREELIAEILASKGVAREVQEAVRLLSANGKIEE